MPTLKSIEFKSDRIHQLFSVRCQLTNNKWSPEFAAEGIESENYGQIDFTEHKRKVTQVQSNSSIDGRIYSLWLNDAAGQPVYSYNTTGSGVNGSVYQLEENERIIGVYGQKAGKTRIVAFGFICIDISSGSGEPPGIS